MMPSETSRAIDYIEAGFHYDVNKATVALFYLLQGMEIASYMYQEDPGENRVQQSLAGPRLTHLKTFPAVSTTGMDMLGPNGEAVQLAFKGWVADIFNKWEKSRAKTRELLGEEGIPVEVECMGDFRHIRHDLIHSGSATKDHSGKCRVLKWFKPGEQMILTTGHVFDLLNQMSLISPPVLVNSACGQRIASWMLAPDAIKPASLEDEQIRIVSIRTSVDTDGEQGSNRYMISCVFSDGIFGQGQVNVTVEPEQYLKGAVEEDGNIAFGGGQVLDIWKIYEACYGYLSGDRQDGPGIEGPDARYMKEPSI
ncbi:MAG: hypothetical protein OXD46_15605 [Chloroflexi bacterium]|nr:hypothetical protein [Chloroflexota bacterium]